MGTEVLNFGILESELEQVKSSLKGVDENIKRLIGRDPSELPLQRPGLKRPPLNDDRSQRPRGLPGNRRVYSHENDEPPNKRRGSVFNRLAGRVTERPSHYEEEFDGKANRQMISKVIVTPKEVPSRQDALDAQSKDEKSKARNRRMFGALLGTLQKFQQEETKLKFKEEKRAQVEKKIEEIEIREKAEIRKERTELFYSRKKKQAEIKMIEMKMGRMRDYMHWEELQKPRMNFIFTKTKPQIHYLPRKLNEANKAALAESKLEIEKMIELKRQETQEELKQIEERMKRNFEPKKSKDTKDVEEDHEHEMEGLEEDRGEQEEAKMETQDLVECSEKVEVPKVLESTEDSEEVTDKSEVVEEKDEEKVEEVAAETNLNGQNSEHD